MLQISRAQASNRKSLDAPNLTRTDFVYDANRNMTRQRVGVGTPLEHEIRMAYAQDNLTSRSEEVTMPTAGGGTHVETITEQFTYDAAGRMKTHTDPRVALQSGR